MISYKPFYQTLFKKGLTEYQLIFKQGLSVNMLYRMKKGEAINTKTSNVLSVHLLNGRHNLRYILGVMPYIRRKARIKLLSSL